MRKLFVSSAILFFFSTFAYAEDFCSRLPGHWSGIFDVKNLKDCQTYGGCTHLVTADVTYISGINYKVHLMPAIGDGGVFDITCQNNKITSPVNPGNVITFNCHESGQCFIIYNDAQQSAEATNK